MSYTKTNYQNGSAPYLNATNLNHSEQGIYDNDVRSTTNATSIGTLSNLNTTEKSNLVGAINEVNTRDSNVMGYDEYSSSSTYAVGDYSIYDNKLYKCNTAIETAEAFDSTKWDETSINEILSNTSTTTSIETTISSVGISKTISGVTTSSGTQVITKSGYWPLAITGYSVTNSHFSLAAHYLSDMAEGTATINYTIGHNATASETAITTVYVTWIKLV